MDRYAVIGHPVEHSRSPWIHARFAELTGEPIEYGRILAPLDDFAGTLERFEAAGGRGCNVTVPFKFDAAKLARSLTPRAELAQAANVLCLGGAAESGWLGDNTDGIGLVRDIEGHASTPLQGRSILVAGAGGAAAGVLGPLLQARPRRLAVVNRSLDRAQRLVERHRRLAQECGVALDVVPGPPREAFDIVINATSASLLGAASPVGPAALHRGTLAIDLMYGPAARPFLEWARSHGAAAARDGLGMLVEQAAEAFFVWRRVRPPSAPVLAELRALVDAVAA